MALLHCQMANRGIIWHWPYRCSRECHLPTKDQPPRSDSLYSHLAGTKKTLHYRLNIFCLNSLRFWLLKENPGALPLLQSYKGESDKEDIFLHPIHLPGTPKLAENNAGETPLENRAAGGGPAQAPCSKQKNSPQPQVHVIRPLRSTGPLNEDENQEYH